MTSTLTRPEPGASAIVNGIAGWHTSEDPPPEELVGQRLIVVAGLGEPACGHNAKVGSVLVTHKAPGRPHAYWCMYVPPLYDLGVEVRLHPGCIVGAVTLAERVPIRKARSEWRGRCIAKFGPDLKLVDLHANPMAENISDQLPWADWSPGRWAWRFENPKPTTQECPVCGGRGGTSGSVPYTIARWRTPCLACHGDGTCPPFPYSASEGLAEFDPGRLR